MRYLYLLATALFCFSTSALANWQKINDVDYIWGPFTIYNLALFSETGEYVEGTRPVMLTLKYSKPVDGRDFAISLARSWSNLGITLPEQDKVVEHLRKVMPNIKKGDTLSYIALSDRGYFVLNDTVIETEFNQDFNNAVVSVWLDPRVEIGKTLLSRTQKKQEMVKPEVRATHDIQPLADPKGQSEQAEVSLQAVSSAKNFAENTEKEEVLNAEPKEDEPVIIFPPYDPVDLFPSLG